MWLINYDLHDLHRVFVSFRFIPTYEKNLEIAERIKAMIDAPQVGNGININNIRHALSSIEGLDKENWYWVDVENCHTYGVMTVTEDSTLRICSEGLGELIKCFKSGDNERLWHLADALHNIPIILAEKRGRSAVKSILFEIGSYRKKYDASFLKNVLKK